MEETVTIKDLGILIQWGALKVTVQAGIVIECTGSLSAFDINKDAIGFADFASAVMQEIQKEKSPAVHSWMKS